MSITLSFLDQYEPLDVIGNGSFGIIRKVRRKQDGAVSTPLDRISTSLEHIIGLSSQRD
jgi:hypothetical protein